MADHSHIDGLDKLRERIRMASIMACGGIPNAEAYEWACELRDLTRALADVSPKWEWDYGSLTHGPLSEPIWIAWDNGSVDYADEGASVDFTGCVGWMPATPPEAPAKSEPQP